MFLLSTNSVTCSSFIKWFQTISCLSYVSVIFNTLSPNTPISRLMWMCSIKFLFFNAEANKERLVCLSLCLIDKSSLSNLFFYNITSHAVVFHASHFRLGFFIPEKNKQGEGWGHTFLNPPPGIFRFFTLFLEILDKTKLHP